MKTIDNKIIHEASLQDALSKDKDIEKVCEKLITELGKLDNELSEKILENSNLLVKFNETEENVLKLMEKKHHIDKELKEIEELSRNEVEVNFLYIFFNFI